MTIIETLTIFGVVARTLIGEASTQGHDGRMMVASAIYNRAGGDVEKFKAVCLKRKAFSCWNGKDGERLAKTKFSGAVWQDCLHIANMMCRGTFKPVTTADHYYADYIPEPYWAKKMTFIVQHRAHKFYKA